MQSLPARRRRKALLLLLVLLPACAVARVSPSPAPQNVLVVPSAQNALLCGGGEGGALLDVPRTAELVCALEDLRHCSLRVPIRVRNCSKRWLRLSKLTFSSGDPGSGRHVVVEPTDSKNGRLDPKEAFEHGFDVRSAETFEVRAILESPDSAAIELTQKLSVSNPTRERLVAECAACKGTWGSGGLSGNEFCNCMTADAGMPCDHEAACEGQCMNYREEPVVGAPPATAPACDARETLFTFRGHCSERKIRFGCRTFVEAPIFRCKGPGVSSKTPMRLPMRCAD